MRKLKNIQAQVLKTTQLATLKGGKSSIVIDDQIDGFKNAATPKNGIVIDDHIQGF